MGYTKFSIQLVEKYLEPSMSVFDFGSMNDYSTGEMPPPFISKWYHTKGNKIYICVDLGGDNKCLRSDCAYPLQLEIQFDLVCDMGFSEHVVQMKEYTPVVYEGNITSVYPKGEVDIERGYYNCWLNKHNACKVGGYIISENPKTGSWLGHGYSYLSTDFYKELAKIADYEILELGEHPACGNDIDGFNIYCVLKKTGERFPPFDDFNKLPIYKK